MTHYIRRKISSLAAILLIGLVCLGCEKASTTKRIYHNPYPRPRLMAVTPFMNLSGSDFLDVIAVTDEFYAELQQVDGLQVVPVNRVLAALTELGVTRISSPSEALALADALEADDVIVGAITQYDPYFPPRAGIAIQLYSRDQKINSSTEALHVNPGEMARSAKTLELNAPQPMRPRAAVVRIFDADREEVVERIKKYAESRSGHQSPTGWKTYTTSKNYLRFVAHEIIGELLAQEDIRLNRLHTPERDY